MKEILTFLLISFYQHKKTMAFRHGCVPTHLLHWNLSYLINMHIIIDHVLLKFHTDLILPEQYKAWLVTNHTENVLLSAQMTVVIYHQEGNKSYTFILVFDLSRHVSQNRSSTVLLFLVKQNRIWCNIRKRSSECPYTFW